MTHRLNNILINTLLAVFCGLLLLWFSTAYPFLSKRLVDLTGDVLSLPEKPALELRMIVQAASNWVLERKNLQDRNKELELENLALRRALQSAAAPIPETTSELLGARVTLRYPNAWWKEVRVDKGARHGVRLGAPVVSDGFLIGVVSSVRDDYAWIELITSASFLLAAAVDDTWDLGVVEGDDRGNIWLQYTPQEKKFERGMIVSTALVGDYLPPGIPIGKIWGPGEGRDGFLPWRIASGAHLTQLYNVQILLRGAEGSLP